MKTYNTMTKAELVNMVIERDKMITNLQFKGLDVPKAADEVGRFNGVVTIHASKAPEYRVGVAAQVEIRVHTETGRLDLKEVDVMASERGPWLRTPSRTYVAKKGPKAGKETRVHSMLGRKFLDNVIVTIGKALRNGFKLTQRVMDPDKADAFDAIMEVAPAFTPKAPATIGSDPTTEEALKAIQS